MSELKSIYAYTETEGYDYFPGYVNYSLRDGGRMILTVRGTNQQQGQEIELPLLKFWDMVAAVGSFNLPADIEFVPSIFVDTLSDKCKQLADELSASQAREAELQKKLEAAEARIKASQEQEPEFVDFEVYGYVSDSARVESWCREKDWRKSEFLNIIGEDWVQKDTIRNVVFHHYAAPVTSPELAELQCENAELRKLLEESKVPDWKSIIIDRLHSKVGVCMTCGQHKCQHGSNTTLPDTVQIDDVLWCINLDEHFFKESAPQPKEPKQ